MTTSITGMYEFDPHGTNPANIIDPERQTLQNPDVDDYYFIIPKAAPFFVDSFQVWNDTTNAPYVEGDDFLFGHYFPEAMDSIGRPIAGSIRFLKRTISGIVRMRYRTLGGQWGFSDQTLLAELSNKQYNPLIRIWGQIDVLPASFPVVPHDQSLDTLDGAESFREALEGIADAIAGTQGEITENHLTDYTNPHNVTKTQVGLGNVQNFAPATEQDMRDGQATDRYATPRGVQIAIEHVIFPGLYGHIGHLGNPHAVNKDQVGLGNVANYPPATAEEAVNTTINNRYLTPYTAALLLNAQSDVGRIQALEDDLASHKVASNPHNITPGAIGTLTTAEIQALVNSGSGNASSFAGKDEEEWRQSLPSFDQVTTLIQSQGTYFETAGLNAAAVNATDPITPQQKQEAQLTQYTTVIAGYDGWGVVRGNLRTELRQSTGNAYLPATVVGGRSKVVILQNAQYYADEMGDVFNYGSASIPTPVLNAAALGIWANKTAVYCLRPDDSLVRYNSSGEVVTLYASGVDTLYANTEDGAAGEMVLIQMTNGSLTPYGLAEWVSSVNALLTSWNGNGDRQSIQDVVIGNNHVAFQFANDDVLVYAIDRSSGIALTPVTLPAGYPSKYTQISGSYDHLGMLDADGKVWFYGTNLAGEQEVSAYSAPYLAIACGKHFTVTLDSNQRLMYWGDSPDNALLPKGLNLALDWYTI